MKTKGVIGYEGWVVVPLICGGNITKFQNEKEFIRSEWTFRQVLDYYLDPTWVEVEIPKEWQNVVMSEKKLILMGYL